VDVATHDALVETSNDVLHNLSSIASLTVLVNANISALDSSIFDADCLPYRPERINAGTVFNQITLVNLIIVPIFVARVLADGGGVNCEILDSMRLGCPVAYTRQIACVV